MEKYSKKYILAGIKNRKDDILQFLYREYYPQVRQLVTRQDGNEDDARDLFQEALIIIFKKLNRNDLVIKGSFHSYFIVLCKFIWYQQNGINENLDDIADGEIETAADPEEGEIATDKRLYIDHLESRYEKIYQRHYRKLHGDCKKVLKMFFRKKSYREIAAKMGYANEDYARRKKYLCMQQLMKMVSLDPEYIGLKKQMNQEQELSG